MLKNKTPNIKPIIDFYQTIRIPTLYAIIVVLCCVANLMPLLSNSGIGFCILLGLLSYISAMRLKGNFQIIKDLIDKTWKRIVVAVAFLYFDFSICGIFFLEASRRNGYLFPGFIYLFLSVVWLLPLFFQVVLIIYYYLDSKINPSVCASWIIRLMAFLLLLGNYCLWLYAFNPGITSPDSYYVYSYAHQVGSIELLDWHPPFFTILVSFLIKICDSVSFLVFLQCSAFSLLVVKVVFWLYKRGASAFEVILIYLFWGFSFNNTLQMLSFWKDIPFMISITWLTFLIAQFVLEKEELQVWWYIKLPIAMFFTSLFRQNGIFPVLAVTIVLIIISLMRKKLRIIIPIVMFFAMFILIKGPVYNYYRVQSCPGLKYFALANDLLCTYYEIDNPSEGLIEMVDEITDDNPDEWEHSPYWTYYNSSSLSGYSIPKFLSVYLDTFIKHPQTVVLNVLRRNTVIWSVFKPTEEYTACINRMSEFHEESDSQQVSFPYRKANVFTNLFAKLCTNLTASQFLYVFIWRSGIYLLSVVLLGMWLVLKKQWQVLIIHIPLIVNVMALAAGSGWSDYRYYWPTVIMSLLVMVSSRLCLKSGEEKSV